MNAGPRAQARAPWWSRHADHVAVTALVVASAAVYANTLGNGFAYDDVVQVVTNPQLRQVADLPALFAAPTWPGWVYRPVVVASYALTYAAVGLEPWPYHATNVLLHALATALAYLVLARTAGRRLGFLACLLFAVHPIHVDAVAGVANRTELLAACFALLCVWLALRRDEARAIAGPASAVVEAARLAAIGATCLLALLAKESALVLFLLVPLGLWAQRRADAGGRDTVRALAARLGPPLLAMGVALAIAAAARVAVLGALVPPRSAITVLDNPLVAVGAGERVARALVLLGRYLATIALPLHLGPDYSLGAAGLGDPVLAPESLARLALLALLVAAIALGWRRERRLAFLALWFLAAFALTANIVFPLPTVFGERLAYLPSLGACGLLAWLLLRLPSAPRLAATAVVVALLAARTWAYNPAWRDDDALFQHAIAVEPGSARAQVGYAAALVRNGALSAARRQLAAAIASHPLQAEPHYVLAVADLRDGRREDAIANLERTLALAPLHVPALTVLGQVRLRGGDADGAARLFARAIERDPASFAARLGIVAASLERGELARAAGLRDELLAVDPDDEDLRALSREIDRRTAVAPRGGTERGPVAPAG